MARYSHIPGYYSWTSMKDRCNNAKRHNSHRYAERGITYCERWKSFENFLADMGVRPEGHSLDRIDNNKGYFPENCRWANATEQAGNREPPPGRKTRYVDMTGIRVNHLTFVSFSHSQKGRTYWILKCDCGAERVFDRHDVLREHTRSCGCSQYSRVHKPNGQFANSR